MYFLGNPGQSIAEIRKQLEFVSKKIQDYDENSKKRRRKSSASGGQSSQSLDKKRKSSDSLPEREFSLEKKRFLSDAINTLPPDAIADVLVIIKSSMPDLNVKYIH